MPRCFFGITTNLGWRVMGDRLHDAIQLTGATAGHAFRPFTLPRLLGHVTWSANYSAGEKVAFPVLDPHTAFFLASPGFRRAAAGFDAVVAATSPMAAAFVAHPASPPVFQIVDGTRDLFRRDFGIANISDAAIAREREHFHRVRHTFALSTWVRDNIVEVYGVPADRVSVIRPMAPCAAAAARPARPPRPPGARLQVAFVGGDFLRKGGDRLLAWQRAVLHEWIDLHLVTDERFRDPSVPNARWYGALDNASIVDGLLPRMDVLCHPTTRDCSAIVVAEAALNGVPCLTTTVGGIPDLVDHGHTGYLFPSSEDGAFIAALLELARDPALLASLGANARAKAVREFAADRVFATILAQVQRTLARA